MKQLYVVASLALCAPILLGPQNAFASKPVSVLEFVRAETDMTLKRYVDQGAFGKLRQLRKPTPIDKQDIIRMNRDTLYSMGVFDLTEPSVTNNFGGCEDGRINCLPITQMDLHGADV